ncbi:MAG: hypothetical protein LC650_02530 [Actinobacteria bacterium]|nr:hypothetical protein [Actinomycetota bacterium]
MSERLAVELQHHNSGTPPVYVLGLSVGDDCERYTALHRLVEVVDRVPVYSTTVLINMVDERGVRYSDDSTGRTAL